MHDVVNLKANSKNVIPVPIFTRINSSRNPEAIDITRLPPEFIPYLIRGGSAKSEIYRGYLKLKSFKDKEQEASKLLGIG